MAMIRSTLLAVPMRNFQDTVNARVTKDNNTTSNSHVNDYHIEQPLKSLLSETRAVIETNIICMVDLGMIRAAQSSTHMCKYGEYR